MRATETSWISPRIAIIRSDIVATDTYSLLAEGRHAVACILHEQAGITSMAAPSILHCSRHGFCSKFDDRQHASKLEQAQKLRRTCWYSAALTGVTTEHAIIAHLQHGAVENAPDIGLALGCAANAQLWMFSHSMLNDLCCERQSCPILLLLRGQLARSEPCSDQSIYHLLDIDFQDVGHHRGRADCPSRCSLLTSSNFGSMQAHWT